MRRRGRPSMLGTVARTAVVATTAQSAAGRVHRKQQQQWAAQDAAAQAPPPPHAAASPPPPAAGAGETTMDEKLNQLQQLGTLRDQGILSDAEFEAKKAMILG